MTHKLVTTVSLVLTLGFAFEARADCAAGPFTSVLPASGAPLPANGIIIIEWSAGAGPEIARQEPFLGSGDSDVDLKIVGEFRAQSGSAQVVFKPVRELVLGRVYELKLRKPIEGRAKPDLTVWKPGSRRPIAWKVVAPDRKPPHCIQEPKAAGVEHHAYGCGDSIHHVFKLNASVDTAWVLVEVEPVASAGSVARLLLTPRQDEIRVGHGMCDRTFRFSRDIKYRLQFTAVDRAGNSTPAHQDQIVVGTE
jgi:hypothetical protein